MGKKVTEVIEALVQPILVEKKMELVDVEYKKEGSNWFLRVFIDKEEGGVDIDDCGMISEALSKELDKVDPIPSAYFLEVSSPGAERPLKSKKDMHKAVGKQIYITTYETIHNQKEFEGKLVEFDDDNLTIELNKKNIDIPYEKVASARLALVF